MREREANTRVLIAEVKKTIKKFVHECLEARDGLQAWKLYQDTPEVDVIISD